MSESGYFILLTIREAYLSSSAVDIYPGYVWDNWYKFAPR